MASNRDPRVYPFREDSELLFSYAEPGPGRWLLELGCGEGRVALAAARSGARVVASDLNPWALRRVAALARRERLSLIPVRTDLFRGLRKFDRVLVNPPYLPTNPESREGDSWANLALDGGPDGSAVARRFVRELPHHLLPGGAGYLIVSSEQSAESRTELFAHWTRLGGPPKVVGERVLEGERLEVWELTTAEDR